MIAKRLLMRPDCKIIGMLEVYSSLTSYLSCTLRTLSEDSEMNDLMPSNYTTINTMAIVEHSDNRLPLSGRRQMLWNALPQPSLLKSC